MNKECLINIILNKELNNYMMIITKKVNNKLIKNKKVDKEQKILIHQMKQKKFKTNIFGHELFYFR